MVGPPPVRSRVVSQRGEFSTCGKWSDFTCCATTRSCRLGTSERIHLATFPFTTRLGWGRIVGHSVVHICKNQLVSRRGQVLTVNWTMFSHGVNLPSLWPLILSGSCRGAERESRASTDAHSTATALKAQPPHDLTDYVLTLPKRPFPPEKDTFLDDTIIIYHGSFPTVVSRQAASQLVTGARCAFIYSSI